jgi:predicted dehydrogenase
MNIAVIGLGSMGKRRIRLIKKHNSNYNIIGADSSEERRISVEDEFGIKTVTSIEEIIEIYNPMCAFVCTPPLSHSKLINVCLYNGLHVFTELNLVIDGYDENIQLAQEKNKVLFLSSTFLYRAETRKIKELVKASEEKKNYVYHVGQYLPDWHPWESYKDFFVGDKRTNGCREILAIELPWIVDAFGDIKDIFVIKSKITSLDIDYNDNYMLILEHVSGNKGMIAADVVSRKAVRNFEMFSENIYVSWDGSPEGFRVMDAENNKEEHVVLYDKIDKLSNYSKFVIENAYYSETEAFFNAMHTNTDPAYDFIKDKKVLQVIDRIEA